MEDTPRLSPSELRTLFLFESLEDDQLAWLSEHGRCETRPAGEEVCISVSDTGVGMTEEVSNRAVEPFFTTKPDGLGSGLGLSMVHGFVQQSGGHIEIKSEAGQGTTITIRLPRVETVSWSTKPGAAAGSSATGLEKAVLLVEDDLNDIFWSSAHSKSRKSRIRRADEA